MKKIMLLCVALLSANLFAGGTKEESLEAIRVSGLNGPSSIVLSQLFEYPPEINGVTSSFEVSASADVLLPKLLKGEIDIGVLPVNVAAKVYNANNEAIILAGISGQGMMSIVSKDESITSLEDLKGKKLTVAGQGGTPEYMIRYLCEANGIEIGTGDNAIELDFSIPTAEIAVALISGKTNYALLVEPFATVSQIKDPTKSVKRVLDIQELYKTATGKDENYPITAIVVRNDFAKKHPEALREMINSIESSIEWVNMFPAEAGTLVEKHGLGLTAPIVTKSIPTSNFEWVPAIDAKDSVENLLSLFLASAPQAIGGKLPSKGFYFD